MSNLEAHQQVSSVRRLQKGSEYSNLYIKFDENKLVVVYVDDIIFGSNVESMSQGFSSVIKHEFEMPLLSELTYFLRLQVQQTKGGIFLSQTMYPKQIMRKYGMEDQKPVCTPMVTGWNPIQNEYPPLVNQP